MATVPRLVVITGLPGSGKSSTAREVVKLLRGLNVFVTWIWRFITRPYRRGEIKGTENLRVTVKQFLRMKKAHKLFHPTETDIPHWGKHYRGYTLMSMWTPRRGTNIMMVVAGPRAALEILDRWPNAVAVFLTAPHDILLERIQGRGDPWGTSLHPEKIREYETMYGGLGIEEEFRRRGIPVIDTHEHENDTEAIARRIVSMLGFNPLASKFIPDNQFFLPLD